MLQLTSPVFRHGEKMPKAYGCHGEGMSPPLAISNVPIAAKSLVLILDDPDAPSGSYIHWLIWNIAPTTNLISENSLPAETVVGINSSEKNDYSVPCPPSGTHHYVFHLYALDRKLDLPTSSHIADIQKVMTDHILEEAELIGIYSL
jgi:hypothetical protein